MKIPKDKSTTFLDNMSLPIHRWYRYSAEFSAEWVETVINSYVSSKPQEDIVVMDPFAGSGTTLLVCDKMGIASISYEA